MPVMLRIDWRVVRNAKVEQVVREMRSGQELRVELSHESRVLFPIGSQAPIDATPHIGAASPCMEKSNPIPVSRKGTGSSGRRLLMVNS